MESNQAMQSAFEYLPLEIIGQICAHLAARLGHIEKRSIAALASVNRRIRSVASRFQFQTIQIRFIYRADISQEVDIWRKLLDGRGCASHVRRLAIVEDKEPPDEWDDEEPEEQWPSDSRKQYPFEPVGHEIWPLDKDDEFWTCLSPIKFDPWESVPTPSQKAKEQAAWAPLAAFIASLSGLADVDYQCKSQIPVNILTALNGKDGGPVRLHMYAFSLRSLYQDRSLLHYIDEDEFYLTTSPCLSSICLLLPHRGAAPQAADHSGRLCFNEDAVAQMVQGLAPNLRSVTVATKYSKEKVQEGNVASWPGFFPSRPADDTSRASGRGTLEVLALEHGASDTIHAWASRTDFAALHSLHLRNGCMSLWTRGFWGPNGEYEVCDFGDSELARLLRALPPLRSLEIKGTFADEAFGAILSSHGPSLRRLRLVPARDYNVRPRPFVLSYDHNVQPRPFVLSRENVEALVRACPNIRDLELLVPRSKGDEAEARIYFALAELRMLDRLSLLLDCSNILAVEEDSDQGSEDEDPGEGLGDVSDEGSNKDEEGLDADPKDKDSDRPSDEDLDEGSSEGEEYLWSRQARDGIINLNTSDEGLATDIFDALCLHRSPRLIRLYPEEIGNFGTEVRTWSIIFITDLLSRAWIRERDDRVGHEGEARITEVETDSKERPMVEPISCDFHEMLEGIWPEAETWPRGAEITRQSFPLWKPS